MAASISPVGHFYHYKSGRRLVPGIVFNFSLLIFIYKVFLGLLQCLEKTEDTTEAHLNVTT